MKFAALLSLFAVLNGSTEATPLAAEETQLACCRPAHLRPRRRARREHLGGHKGELQRGAALPPGQSSTHRFIAAAGVPAGLTKHSGVCSRLAPGCCSSKPVSGRKVGCTAPHAQPGSAGNSAGSTEAEAVPQHAPDRLEGDKCAAGHPGRPHSALHLQSGRQGSHSVTRRRL